MNRYYCCDERRREALLGHPGLNGLDALEVLDDPTLPVAERQRVLVVRFVNPLAALAAENFRIEGGVRIRDIRVLTASDGDPDTDGELRSVRLQLDRSGDFSRYTLRLAAGQEERAPPPGFDPLLASIDFSFKAACAADIDCQPASACAPESPPAAAIGYLARDYQSFRRLLLDRMASQLPDWTTRSPADLGVALVELLAYAGDMLSYRQDAIGTEAYLGTARLRGSVRRHARLVDYFLHEGCNARAWLQLAVRADVAGLTLAARIDGQPTLVLTRVPDLPDLVSADAPEVAKALALGPRVFELMHDIRLYAAHNQIDFYTWGARECCLPRGATRATLAGHFSDLAAGDVLILAEVRGPATGLAQDADPAKRHALRLTAVTLVQDLLGGRFQEPPSGDAVSVTEIAWSEADALPFPLCLSARSGTQVFDAVSRAFGNVVLVDHGHTLGAEALPAVPAANPLLRLARPGGDPCQATSTGSGQAVQEAARPARYRPRLADGPLTWAVPYDPTAAATQVLATDCRQAEPHLGLTDDDGDVWQATRDLLAHAALDRVFAVETDDDGLDALRFGDGIHGARPAPGPGFAARYRVGNGISGNVGAGSLAHLVSADPALVSDPADPLVAAVTHWLPAQGGQEPETLAETRAAAPFAFRTQERAVTSEDYAVLARRFTGVQRVQATPRWTGSWRTVFVSVDRQGGQAVDADFEDGLRRHLEAFRLAGQDMEIDAPREVPLEIELEICVAAGHFPAKVGQALRDRFHNGIGADGQLGLFHPDRFSFGEPAYLSPLVAAAQATPGVASLRVTRFQRFGQAQTDGREAGQLAMERLEIARLDNDANFPERGVFNLVLKELS